MRSCVLAGRSAPPACGGQWLCSPACAGLPALALAGDRTPRRGNPPSPSLVAKPLDCLCEGPVDTGSQTGLLPCLQLACGGFLECPAVHAPSRSFLGGSCPGSPRPLPGWKSQHCGQLQFLLRFPGTRTGLCWSQLPAQDGSCPQVHLAPACFSAPNPCMALVFTDPG